MTRRRPLGAVVLHQNCPECGQALWGFTYDIAGPGEHEPGLPFHVAICVRCDFPAGPGMPPRLIHPETKAPIPQKVRPYYERDWFLLLMVIALIAGAMKACGAL